LQDIARMALKAWPVAGAKSRKAKAKAQA
jgi:hypothetical protein